MSSNAAGAIFGISLVVALVVTYRPLGDYMARIFSSERHSRAERVIYRIGGVDPDAEQTPGGYVRSVLAFSAVSILFLYAFLRLQQTIRLGHAFAVPQMDPSQSWNTAVSFVTNTNWQSYSGESALGYVAQATGLTVQNFASGAVGIAVALALVRGFARSRSETVGNFWVDLVRACVRLALPLSIIAALVLIGGGVIENWHNYQTVTGIAGAKQTIVGGPIGSQEAIKELFNNGGGPFNANSAHPFENPTSWTNWLEIYLLLAIPFALPRTFGRMVKDPRQGRAIAIVMALLLITTTVLVPCHRECTTAPSPRRSAAQPRAPRPGSAYRIRQSSRRQRRARRPVPSTAFTTRTPAWVGRSCC